jgi:membrane-associated phospholipid phosphatase
MLGVLRSFLRGVLVAGAFMLCSAGSARAEDEAETTERPGPEGERLLWNPAWPEFRTSEWVLTGASIAALAVSKLVPQRSTHVSGGVLFDEAARDLIRVRKPSGRRWARDGSDIGIVINESWPFFDSLVIAGWYRRSPHVGVQQALITAEVLAVTAGMQGVVSSLVSRERPYVRECGGDLSFDSRDCTVLDRYWSFYSGHTSQSFAGATVLCMHHAYVPLYGGGWRDGLACVGALGVATTTALMRMATDVHYASDVMVGALMGSATGILLPWALHYRHGAPLRAAGETAKNGEDWSLSVTPMGLGLSGVVTF